MDICTVYISVDQLNKFIQIENAALISASYKYLYEFSVNTPEH